MVALLDDDVQSQVPPSPKFAKALRSRLGERAQEGAGDRAKN